MTDDRGDDADDGVPDLDLTGSATATADANADGRDPDTATPFGVDLGGDPDASDRADADADGDENAESGSEGEGEVEPVELLVQLAEEGEIEPWDIDVVAVTDAFLARLDDADLRTSGRALFYASVLLRMKSDALLGADEDEEPAEEGPEPWEAALAGGAADPGAGGADADGGEGDDAAGDPVAALEAEMDRRLDRRRARGSPETLDELVRELRAAERDSRWKTSREYDTSDSPRGFARGAQTLDYRAGDDRRREAEPTEGDVTDTAHEEEIETTIDHVRDALRGHYDAGRDEVLFAEVRGAGGRPFMTYLALLFLADRGAVELRQDDLFGDLWVRDPDATAAPDEAVAD